jgi:hypothetical protein
VGNIANEVGRVADDTSYVELIGMRFVLRNFEAGYPVVG